MTLVSFIPTAVHCGLLLQPVLLNTDETDADFAALLSDQPRGMNMKRRRMEGRE